MGNLQASPSSSTTTPKEKYDVFINFRGEIRDGFANNLREALLKKHVIAFMDVEATKGENVTQIFKTIEESKISIVIFSKDYGSSEWCLNELLKIMDCNKRNKQTVIPVFYCVEPSTVLEDSFVKQKEKFPEEVQKWEEALKEASSIVGFESSKSSPDTKLVTAIVDDIYKKLTGDENISSPSDFKGLIGLDERINNVKSLLCLHETNVRTIGILGMGGIGKTTLARVIFNEILCTHQFEGVCFIEDVGGKLEYSGGLVHLQEDILSKVLNDKELISDCPGIIPSPIKNRLKQTKVFIVLDNVDDFKPLKILASGVELGQGSRIIITSRDKLVLLNCEVDNQKIYEVKEFNHHEALQLFCNHAFNHDQPTEDLRKLSNDIVNYAGGNPLALTVFGSSLRGSSLNQERQKKVWETTVDKLRTNFNSSIFKKLKISYDGLEDEAKGVFLDIACFLKGRDRDYVASILDDCDCWLEDLIHKSLITVSHKTIQMHDLLQDLGRDIVRKQSPKNPGKRSRLWAPEDGQHTLKNNAETNAIQGIFLDMSKIKHMHLSLEVFNKMYNLRLLKFYNDERDTQSSNKVHFREGLNNASFDKLRSFIWFGYPLPALSSNFNLENLVELDLSYSSNFERLWEDTEDAPKLKWLRLKDCSRLEEIPDLSKSPLLERIHLNGCSSLTKIQSLSKLENLKEIYLNGCSELEEIPDLSGSPLLVAVGVENCGRLLEYPLLAPHVSCLRDLEFKGLKSLTSFPSTIVLHFKNLKSLSLSSCSKLKTFPQISGNITCLDLSGTKIEEVPPSIENLIKLSSLALPKSIRLISPNICKLKSLVQLNLENSQLESFPEILDKMERLQTLNLSGTAIKELPHSIEQLTNLWRLYLRRCTKLESLPSSISNLIYLQHLDISDCSKLEILPDNLGNLKSLKDLTMDRIVVSQLPPTMMHLKIAVKISCRGCKDLRFTDLLGLPCSLTRIDLNDCKLEKIPEDISCLSSLNVLELRGNNFESLPESMKQLSKLTSLEVDNCNMLHSLTQLPSALNHLSASGCKKLRSIPDASEFTGLHANHAKFIFTNCLNLETAVGDKLETLKKRYEEGDEIGLLTFFCPGSKVPEWFMYRTEGSSIVDCCELKFQMPQLDGPPLLGFVVCTVIAFENYCCDIECSYKYLFVGYKYTCSDGDEKLFDNSSWIKFFFGNETLINLDHITFQFFKSSVPPKSESDFINWSFKLWPPGEENSNCRLKSFGVCPIYAKQ